MRQKAALTIMLAFASVLLGVSENPPRPLGKIELVALLVSYVSQGRLAKLVQQRGINFQMTDGYAAMLTRARASELVLKAVAVARVVELSAPASASAATEQVILDHLVRGYELREKDRDADADEEFQSAVNADPSNPFTHFVLGSAYGAKETEAAVDEFREAIRLQPDWPEALVRLGNLLEDGAAVTTLREALRLEPNNSGAHVLLGDVLWKMGDHVSAASEFKMASNDPLSPGIPQRIRVGGQVEAARLLSYPFPKYPSKAKRKGLEGTVRLEAIIGRDGEIKDIKFLQGDPILAKAATEAVSRWRYRPTLLNDEPVEVVTEIDVNFTL